jgi:hypothetical protein
MAMHARHLTIVHYPSGQDWSCVEVRLPEWEMVSAAIRKMDDNEYPIVQLSCKDVGSCFDDEQSLQFIGGGASGFALFEFLKRWEFDDPAGGDEGVRLWQSDQGYFCKRRNIVTDIDTVLILAKTYFETGSYEAVQREVLARQSGRDPPIGAPIP